MLKTYPAWMKNCSISQSRGWRHSTRLLPSCYLELIILLLRNKKYVWILCSCFLKCFLLMFLLLSYASLFIIFCFLANSFFLAPNHQVATIQGLSGTGSLRLAAALIERYFPGAKVLISSPTWGAFP